MEQIDIDRWKEKTDINCGLKRKLVKIYQLYCYKKYFKSIMSIASLLDKQACLTKMNQYTVPFLKTQGKQA